MGGAQLVGVGVQDGGIYMGVVLLAFALISIGIYTDLRYRKVPNKLSLSLFVLSFIAKIVIFGQAGLIEGLIGTGAVIGLMLPLVLARALGAGDMKLMLSFGMLTNWSVVFWTLIYSIIWGAVLGLMKALLNKQGSQLMNGMWSIVVNKGKAETNDMTKIPYTVALLFGFATFVALKGTNLALGVGL
ncbi:MAG: hypothetical protein CL677_03925 [Bdellovibrionaceae bacterium]|nr:hypothetical protein [Pseudobdellovibrionaceae bacterium]|tara:strand:+ start:441 stop:1001 length:561 start_codon:yes stop_codon:yes gene_type:complete